MDELWKGGPSIIKSTDSFKLTTDAVLLADFTNMRGVKTCLDLGCGSGVVGIILSKKNKNSHICGIEIMESAAELARKNFEINDLSERSEVLLGDLREYRSLVKANSFDTVVVNPPYFPQKAGKSAVGDIRATARGEKTCTISDICNCAKWSLRFGGKLNIVHRPERLSEIFCAMSASSIEPKRLRMVSYTKDRAPCLVLVEGRAGGKSGLEIMPPLVIRNDDGTDSDEILKIYHRDFIPKEEE